ncbi:hypothetical protein Glove_132g28 [Diversispora epigaea]|uniref:Uncharacterized protein n=1 Tax=Diversispora epigaea TaxID=1348612 RepID=A0A397J091_9GLOM|nr:hypothetical protein Glove_132g28 [Diversispora epigaea]
MLAKKSDKDDNPFRLAKSDIDAILYASDLKAGIKKVNSHYRIGSTTIKKIWTYYEHANSIEPDIVKSDPIEVKRKRKQAEMERITKNIFRTELGKLIQADD